MNTTEIGAYFWKDPVVFQPFTGSYIAFNFEVVRNQFLPFQFLLTVSLGLKFLSHPCASHTWRGRSPYGPECRKLMPNASVILLCSPLLWEITQNDPIFDSLISTPSESKYPDFCKLTRAIGFVSKVRHFLSIGDAGAGNMRFVKYVTVRALTWWTCFLWSYSGLLGNYIVY